ncbi:hypothetical protein FK531_21670 [Rhodococcus spelaei]|uniref:Adenylate cyclase n=1 Tax=Rhodococcus spelaei TaxID=2546320 RepID=A0A541AZK6_9NOCA|nr:hypothetical protein [Rhodococcus spelaei]TQF65474.1 hypothetical protein FK531_21670 [Rhodococcus spelaei]
MVWSEIGVVFGYVVVCVAIVVVTIGVLMMFIVSINDNFGQRKPRNVLEPTGGQHRADDAG